MSLNLKLDYYNTKRLNQINKLNNFPKIVSNILSKDRKNPKLRVSENTNVFEYFPTFIELLKRDKYISRTPDRNLCVMPNSNLFKGDNLFYNLITDRNNKERIRNHSSDYITLIPKRNNNHKKIYNIKNLRHAYGSPEFSDNSLKINKVITVTPNNYPQTDFRQYNKDNNIKVVSVEDYIQNDTHKMRYLLSKSFNSNKKDRNKNPYLNRSIPLNNIDDKFIDNSMFYMTDINDYPRNKRNNFASTGLDNIIEEDMQSNDVNLINNSFNIFYDNIRIKLDDLAYLEEIFDTIMFIINNNQSILDINTTNECIDFFDFYFNSSLKDKFAYFFGEQNFVIIQTAFNLMLLMLIIIFHLSINTYMLVKSISIIRNIFDKLKINLYLFVKRIQLYYGDAFCCKNEDYFNKFNNFLIINELFDLNEKEIVDIISSNSVFSCNQLSELLNFYRKLNNVYYPDFFNFYISLSKMAEEEFRDYFYNNILNIPEEDINKNINYDLNNYNYDNNSYNIKNNNIYENYMEENLIDDEQYLNDIILHYKKNKEIPPFVDLKTTKKYTIVLDIGGTILNVKLDPEGNALCRWRPGIIPFLEGIKPFYEIIAFSKLSKEYAELIINQIDKYRKYFDYNLYREHCSLVNNKFIKDISRIGRDLRRIIMVDDLPENIENHIDNGILILPYDPDDGNEDKVLFELKKLLILFYKMGYDDLRLAIKKYKNEIYNKITMGQV